jgi:PIN domain nuclease of toxin-antitoxin system
MRLLLDSQVLIWQKKDDARLSLSASDLIEKVESKLIISLTSFWELTIKESLGKLEIPGLVDGLYKDWITTGAAESLATNWNHIQLYKSLPLIHRDPFDRMLIAQAMEENLTIVTCDDNIRKYPGVRTVW